MIRKKVFEVCAGSPDQDKITWLILFELGTDYGKEEQE
jgi:hypothetical protein